MEILITSEDMKEPDGLKREVRIDGIETILRLSPDKAATMFFDAGDWQHEEPASAEHMDALQALAVEWVESLPEET